MHSLRQGLEVTLFVSSLLVLACLAQPVNAGSAAPLPDNIWVDGSFAEYEIRGTVPSNSSVKEISGSLSFNVDKQSISVRLLIDDLGGERFEHTTIFELIDGRMYLGGNPVILPFFYYDNSIICEHLSSTETVTGINTTIGNARGGLLNGQPETSLNVDVSYLDGDKQGKSRSYYTYGTNSGLLFYASILPPYSVFLNGCLGLVSDSGYMPVITLELVGTNIDLGSANMLAVLYAYIVMSLPLIIIIIPVILFAYLYKRSNRKEERNGKHNRNKESDKKIR